MAIIENGYLGGFSGRLGTAVGYRWRGKWCLRSWNGHVRNPRTAAQQSHRMMFKQEVQLAGRMNWALRTTFNAISMEHGMTACNYFIASNQHAFSSVDGTLSVEWGALRLSEGPVAPVAFGALQVSERTVLSVEFERNPLHIRADNFDKVYLYIYCPSLGQGYLSAHVYRRERRIAAVLPEAFAGREVQLWGMVQDRNGRWSDTIYIGYGPLVDTEEPSPNASLPAGDAPAATPCPSPAVDIPMAQPLAHPANPQYG